MAQVHIMTSLVTLIQLAISGTDKCQIAKFSLYYKINVKIGSTISLFCDGHLHRYYCSKFMNVTNGTSRMSDNPVYKGKDRVYW